MLVRSEGGLLPGDVLVRIAAQDRDLGGLTDADYHLGPRERVREAIAQSWARLTTSWEVFSAAREEAAEGDTTGRLTRERWTLPLFTELGYGRLVKQPGPKIEAKSFPVFCQWQHSPIHLVGAGVPLDRRTPNVDGAAEQSPHSLVQELLNRSPERLWGIVTNGLSLRLLRDNVTLTRQAYVEFDVEAIFAEEAFEDFALLWLCCHQSRLEADDPRACWLERWMEAAQRDGTRALKDLRDRSRVRHRVARPRLPLPASQHRPAGGAARRHARRPGVLPRAAAPRLPAAVPVRGRGPRRSAAFRRRLRRAAPRPPALRRALLHAAPAHAGGQAPWRPSVRPLRAGQARLATGYTTAGSRRLRYRRSAARYGIPPRPRTSARLA